MDKRILWTESLSKFFGGLAAVNSVNIGVREKTITMLIGPNGAGKTTLVNLCTGVLKPDSGKIYFLGKDITGWPSHKIYREGFVRTFQIPSPFLKLTVLENVLAALKNDAENPLKAPFRTMWLKQEEENIERAFKILGKVGLEDAWYYEAFKLGGAQLKMLEVARALATGAKLIALDEPIGGVDPAYAGDILSYVKNIKETWGVTFLLIEHRIDIALPFADYVYVMDRGSIIFEGLPSEVEKNSRVIEVYLG
ncbi:MAG: ABC transporter ATP-binding protein [Nitrososphaeria archaeon]|nr:ABC transporter ATP-binding protein [Nitrososphaeria archaeon]MDW7986400.1 ABC transporter ATP-binding protein [Nitrososphaerota archaeon]